VTEHGIYSRERNMDLARAGWIKDQPDAADAISVGAKLSPLRALWSRSFRALSQLAYRRASRIVTLSDVNRARQNRRRRARLEDFDRAERCRRAGA
jgi:hypothetical protein